MANTSSLDALQREIFNTLKYLNDPYVITGDINSIDRKGIRTSLKLLLENYPNIFTKSKKESDGNYYFDGTEKEIIKFLSLTKGVDLINGITANIKKGLINNDYKQILRADPSSKFTLFETFKNWMTASESLGYIDGDEFNVNKKNLLQMLKTSETLLEPTFMEDFLGGYSYIFYETETYLPTLFDAVFQNVPTDTEIDDILVTFFHINHQLLEGTAQFLSEYTGNNSFTTEFEGYLKDVSHNDSWNYNAPSPELYQYLIDKLIDAKHAAEDRYQEFS